MTCNNMEVELVNDDAVNETRDMIIEECSQKYIEHIEAKVFIESKSEDCAASEVPEDKNVNANDDIDTSAAVPGEEISSHQIDTMNETCGDKHSFCPDNTLISETEEFQHVAKKRKMDDNKENEVIINPEVVQKEICKDIGNSSEKENCSDNLSLCLKETNENVDKIGDTPKEQTITEDIPCKSPISDYSFTFRSDNTLNENSHSGKTEDESKIDTPLYEEKLAENDKCCNDTKKENSEHSCDRQDLQFYISNNSSDNKGEDKTEIASSQDEPDRPEDEAIPSNSQQNIPDYSIYEKSVPNDDIIRQALQDSMTSAWDKNSRNPYILTKIDENSFEFRNVKNLFNSTLNQWDIEKLERVENPFILAQYLLKKEQKGRDRGSVAEKKLFHGTQEKNVDGICKSNFDWRLRGSSRGHKFGQGVSFAPAASYAWHYTHGDHVMILAKVLVCKSTVGHLGTVVPPDPYDTTVNSPETVFVKYEDNEFYPEYVIHYS